MSIWARFRSKIRNKFAPSYTDDLAKARALLNAGDRIGALAVLGNLEGSPSLSFDVHKECGLLYRSAGEVIAAERHLCAAMALNDTDPRLLNSLAVLYLKLQRLDEAVPLLQRASDKNPEFLPARTNLGIIHTIEGNIDAAKEQFNWVLDRSPEDIDAIRNAVMLYDEQGDYDAAIMLLDRYLHLAPESDDARYMASLYALRRGDWQLGWQGYEYRWSRLGVPKRLKGVPIWHGETLEGKRILVTDEQGIGDQLLFAGCIPQLVEAGADVRLLCAPKLKELFSESLSQVHVLAAGQDDMRLAHETFDYQIAVGSLPGFFRQSEAQILALSAYLSVAPIRLDRCRARLDELGAGLKVGISWRGGALRTGQLLRSIPLAQWGPLLAVPGVHFVNLQYIDCASEIREVERHTGVRLHTWQPILDDYAETAALTASLDLVISVCTSIVSLAAALGQRTWILTPVSAGWMFKTEGDKSPWFPQAQLFRQSAPRQWSEQMNAVVNSLKQLAKAS